MAFERGYESLQLNELTPSNCKLLLKDEINVHGAVDVIKKGILLSKQISSFSVLISHLYLRTYAGFSIIFLIYGTF